MPTVTVYVERALTASPEPDSKPPAPPPPAESPPPPPPPATIKYSTAVGATPDVVIELLAALGALVPIALVAVTVKVYDVEAVRPVTVIVPEPA